MTYNDGRSDDRRHSPAVIAVVMFAFLFMAGFAGGLALGYLLWR